VACRRGTTPGLIGDRFTTCPARWRASLPSPARPDPAAAGPLNCRNLGRHELNRRRSRGASARPPSPCGVRHDPGELRAWFPDNAPRCMADRQIRKWGYLVIPCLDSGLRGLRKRPGCAARNSKHLTLRGPAGAPPTRRSGTPRHRVTLRGIVIVMGRDSGSQPDGEGTLWLSGVDCSMEFVDGRHGGQAYGGEISSACCCSSYADRCKTEL
jgi:hypothetical protein